MIKTKHLDMPLIDSSSLVDKVEEALIDLLISKKLNPGDKIPKEMELTTMLGVSRTVIRESLTRLRALGLIESVKHKGSVIKSPDLLLQLKKSFIHNILDHNTLRDVFELRLVLEIGMGDLIYHHITKEDIEELENIVKTESNDLKDILFDVDHEILFHGKLYEITKNKTLMDFQSLLLPAFRYVYDSELLNSSSQGSNEKWVSHRDLVEILKTGTPNKFRNAMRKHLNKHFKSHFAQQFRLKD